MNVTGFEKIQVGSGAARLNIQSVNDEGVIVTFCIADAMTGPLGCAELRRKDKFYALVISPHAHVFLPPFWQDSTVVWSHHGESDDD